MFCIKNFLTTNFHSYTQNYLNKVAPEKAQIAKPILCSMVSIHVNVFTKLITKIALFSSQSVI